MIPHKIVLSLIVLSLSIIKSESSHLANLNKTTSVGLSKFYYADKLFYLTLEEPKFEKLNIVIDKDSKTITISKDDKDDICKINTTTFDLQSQDKIFQFNVTCNNDTINTFQYNLNASTINFTYNNKTNLANKEFSYQIYTMQYFLESNNSIFSIIKFIILFSGIYVSFYGHSSNFLVITLFIQYFLFILVEELYEAFSELIIVSEILGMFLFIFSLIIGGALGILFNLKLPKSLPFIYTFSAVFSISKIFIYSLPFSNILRQYDIELSYLSYLAISIVIAIIISTAVLYSNPDIKKYSYLVSSSITGPYIIICGLSYIVGGIVYIKIRLHVEKIPSDSKNEYFIIYLSLFVLSITFQLFHKSFEIRKEQKKEETEQYKKMNSNDTSSSMNYIRPRLSTEMENNFRPSDVGKMIPDENNDNIPDTQNEEPYTEENQDEGYVNEENLE